MFTSWCQVQYFHHVYKMGALLQTRCIYTCIHPITCCLVSIDIFYCCIVKWRKEFVCHLWHVESCLGFFVLSTMLVIFQGCDKCDKYCTCCITHRGDGRVRSVLNFNLSFMHTSAFLTVQCVCFRWELTAMTTPNVITRPVNTNGWSPAAILLFLYKLLLCCCWCFICCSPCGY